MKWDSFAYGGAIGAAAALAISVGSEVTLKNSPNVSLVNFGPAIFGIVIFGLNILAALVAIATASVLLFRHRWRGSGFALAFGVTVVGFWVRVLFY